MKLLTDLCILVTRPRPQGEILCQYIRKAGGEAVYFPVIEMVPEQSPRPLFDALDWLIFISPHAVYHAIYRLPPLTSGLKIAAVGLSTAEVLQANGREVHLYPKDEWSSEGLLNCAEFQHITGKKVLIIKGKGGRELLSDTLTKRGAMVSEWVVYHRVLPKIDTTFYFLLLRNHKIDIIVCTSTEGIRHLVQLLGDESQLLLQIPLLVVSERLKSYATTLGFRRIFLAKNAKHEFIVDTLFREKGQIMTQKTVQVSKEPKIKHQGIRWANIGILFSSLGVVILLIVFYMAFNQFSLIYKNLIALADSTQKGFLSTSNEVRDFNQRLQQLSDEMTKQSQNIAQLQGMNLTEWRIMDAQSLTKLAENQLQFMHNVPVALKMLQTASSELETIADPAVMEIKKALASDIAHLQQVPLINAEEIYVDLIGLDDKLDQLPLPVVQVVQSPESKPDLSKLPWWKRGLHQTWQSLQKIVVVQHADNQKPLVMPEQREALYQNLHAKIETAKWGLIHQQTVIYENSLKQLAQWVKRYFIQDAGLTRSVLSSLERLQKINVAPSNVSVSGSLSAFQKFPQK
jgi:uroporphyrinogen-III synthase